MRKWPLSPLVAIASALLPTDALGAVAADGSSANGTVANTASTLSATVTTGGATCTGGTCLLLAGVTGVTAGGSPHTVTGVCSGGGCPGSSSLVWTRRKCSPSNCAGGPETGENGSNSIDLEVWSAPYPATQTSVNVTFTFNGTIYGAMVVQGFSGVCASAPFDPHAPAITFNPAVAGVVDAGTQTTSRPVSGGTDLLFLFAGVETSIAWASGKNAGAASTVAANGVNISGTLGATNELLYLTPAVSAPQSGDTSATLSSSVTWTGAIIGDALTSECAAAPSHHGQGMMLRMGVE